MSATGGLPHVGAGTAAPIAVPRRATIIAAVAGLTALAAAMRLSSFGIVQPNPFYDAAVRSMSQSWHNFFFAAFDPSGALAIDKPPVDLWLQVASVKLLGFNSVALRLPEALAGTAAVPLLYDLVRRVFSNTAGIAAAAALAVLPVSVLTSRSDTMDSVLLLLMVLAGWLVVRAAQERRTWMLLAAGAVLGLAFNVKLFEALLPLPAFVALYAIASEDPIRARLTRLLAAGAVMVVVSVAWIGAVSLAPGPKPFPIGSTDGTVANVIVRWNGLDRLGGPKTQQGTASAATGAHHRAAHHHRANHHRAARHHHRAHRHRPVRSQHHAAPQTASATRLFDRGKNHLGPLIGAELAAALLLGALAAALGIFRRPAATPEATAARRGRIAAAVAFGAWLVVGVALFSHVAILHVRYLEAVTAAVAAVLGIGLASLATAAPRSRLAAATLALGVSVAAALSVRLSGVGGSASTIATFAAVAVTAGCVVLMLPRLGAIRGAATGTALTALGLVAVLAAPTVVARDLVRSGATDSGRPGYMPPAELQHLSNYLRTHQRGARYEVLSPSAATAGPLIVRDGRPVLFLTTVNGRTVLSRARLAATVRAGQLRYAMLPRGRCTARFVGKARCAPAARWARAHGSDVSAKAHLRRGSLYLLHAR